ncbi:MAG: tetratricopeptide repeat protein [Methanobrevibacter sp.]|uniref:tetratricopeptide repeat protein n=1 Tax=uncultured Methanobrevibacter sp. TaxID=253161 RepID=UPI0025EE22FF|nr:tetratricopeptide repeat protein [uncultured Methanobrevibacter sp.]MEE1129134.1 tetratricopeptide repeat protein [Methanobrevibacter sp.]
MKKQSDEWEDIEVNERSTDKVHFESPLIQSISDRIDFLRDEAKEILEDLDTEQVRQQIDEIDLDELGEDARGQISDIVDDFSQYKSKIINSDDLPEFVRDYSIDAKRALNRDADYVRRAQRKLDRLDSDELVDVYKTNIRVIELCDKAIKVNKSNADAYYIKGLALINLDKYSEAIEEFVSSLAIDDDNKAWIAIGNANALNGDYEDALGIYDLVLERDECSFDAIKGKALTYYASGDYKKADDEFKKADKVGYLGGVSKEIWDECLENI